MKKSDIAMIILIASIGVIAAYFIATQISLLKLPENGVKVQTIPTLNDSVIEPSKEVFNKDAINPTVEITVGNDGNR